MEGGELLPPTRCCSCCMLACRMAWWKVLVLEGVEEGERVEGGRV